MGKIDCMSVFNRNFRLTVVKIMEEYYKPSALNVDLFIAVSLRPLLDKVMSV